jgi:NAD(P)-dependent dehydrogenase (short-subunit alcohol dehydrogenase family)
VQQYKSLLQTENQDKCEAVFIPCDLTSFDSVKSAAQAFVDDESKVEGQGVKLHVLLNNAGIMAVPPGLSTSGYEIQFATNYMGHALLVKLLQPYISSTPLSRIVNVTSLGAGLAPKVIPFDQLKTTQEGRLFAGWWRYGQSKLANILFSKELAVRHPEIMSVSIHPGLIQTNLADGLPGIYKVVINTLSKPMCTTVENGAKNHIWASTTPLERLKNGEFYEPVGEIGRQFSQTKTPQMATELWDWTQLELEEWKLDRS